MKTRKEYKDNVRRSNTDYLFTIDVINEMYDDFEKEMDRLKKHDRLMRDKAHQFNKEVLIRDETIKSNIKQIEELQRLLASKN